ncbi:MAG: hypothetical protein JWQ90_1195 [Hydrocarboniphaga sp.]|uniref:NAD-dependent epimerase/dehydratase family protein n=1 Tax=Hydrocarboniphaga sp. TaxID=2033016 RepID=UPI00260B45CF|nr:NAD-dependent epimerase/dehydratase family protein [Hydrocarboniphaga sp.]MDB5968745.1 hypothetical protein [Hydrocarboniphaga sp.]
MTQDHRVLVRVLVTGVSGFLGGHVALELLRQGYSVLGSVRDLAKAAHVRQALGAAGADTTRLEFCELDLLDDAGWSEAASRCRYLLHVASPFLLVMPEDENELIAPAVEGTRRAIRAALDAGHERIVLTSSLAAVDSGHLDYDRVFTTADWSDPNGPQVNAYIKSKTLAEREAWKLVEARGARDRLCVINPGSIVGPLLDDDPGTSGLVIQRLLKGKVPMVPDMILPYVDVRDVAAAHVAAISRSPAAGSRHILTNPAVSLTAIAEMLRIAEPDRADKISGRRMPGWLAVVFGLFDSSLRDGRSYLGIVRQYDASSGQRLLGRDLRSTSDAISDMARSMIDRALA